MPVDPVALMLQVVTPFLAAKTQTRTERLLQGVIANERIVLNVPDTDDQAYAVAVMRFVRALESELDAVPAPRPDAEFATGPIVREGASPDGGGGIHWHFASCDTFVSWLEPKLEQAYERMRLEGFTPSFSIAMVCQYLTEQVFK
jgi:hypothetical protein